FTSNSVIPFSDPLSVIWVVIIDVLLLRDSLWLRLDISRNAVRNARYVALLDHVRIERHDTAVRKAALAGRAARCPGLSFRERQAMPEPDLRVFDNRLISRNTYQPKPIV